MEQEVSSVKITKNSDERRSAGAIAHRIREGKKVNVTAVGSRSVHIAVKTIARARGFVRQDGGFDLAAYPEHTVIEMDGETVPGISIIVERKQA